jgi:DNA (cytosine-5)-methyltransferase 1
MLQSFADLCSGIGGFRLGLEKLGLQCTYSCEIDADCTKTYNINFTDNIRPTDLLSVDSLRLPDFDILCAGFPCQPFSIAGKRQGGLDERAKILPKILEIALLKKPKVILLENVPHLLRFDGGDFFMRLKDELAGMGYRTFHEVIDSAYFGVPQSRPRVYVVALQNSLGVSEFAFPTGSVSPTPFKPFINRGDNSIPITSKWHEYIDYYCGVKDLNSLTFTPPKTRLSLERADKGIDLFDCVFQMRSSGIRAISLDRPLPTFAVSVSGGGAMIPIYSGERRHLNLTEMKRLMGFNDDFIFPVSRTSAIKQLANAVCPPVVYQIGKKIVNHLSGQEVVPGQRCLLL